MRSFPEPTFDPVEAWAAGEDVVTPAAPEAVSTGAAAEHVATATAKNPVVTGPAVDEVDVVPASVRRPELPGVGVDAVVSAPTGDHVTLARSKDDVGAYGPADTQSLVTRRAVPPAARTR